MLSPVWKYIATWLLYLVQKIITETSEMMIKVWWGRSTASFTLWMESMRHLDPLVKITLLKLRRRLFIHHIITVSSDSHCLIKISLEARVIGLFTWPRANYNDHTVKNSDFPSSITINCHKPFIGAGEIGFHKSFTCPWWILKSHTLSKVRAWNHHSCDVWIHSYA